jgi:hypothetical protein
MTTQLPERDWRTTMQNHQDNQKNTRMIRGDHIPMMIERTAVMLIMVPEGKPFYFAAANVTSVILLSYTRTNVGYTPLSSEAEMSIQLPEREWRTTVQNHQDNQENTTMIRRGDHILMTIERSAMMLIMVPESKPCSFTAAKCNKCNLAMLHKN